jgi:hypothetical protein
MKNIVERIQKKTVGADSLLTIADQLSGSELNSLLLAFFQKLTDKIQPTDLIKQHAQNRFVRPAGIDPIQYKALELECLRLAQAHQFTPLILSPLTPLGTCSVVGEVDQNNVVSALRGTEVVSDATNVLALAIASEYKQQPGNAVIRYATTHRHVRGQYFTNPAFTAHFGVFCLASGGMDTGNFAFELQQLREHLSLHFALLSTRFSREDLFINVYFREPKPLLQQLISTQLTQEKYSFQLVEDDQKRDYYDGIQFKIFLRYNGMEIDLADGGAVNWTQKLIPNKKHRLFISGCGLELIQKIREGQL